MSAIAGIHNINKEPIAQHHIDSMMKALQHFPADDIQVWNKEHTFLGCHAQWITPESINEQLPFYDYQRQLAITSDAIIDNRKELFQLLQVDKKDQNKIPDSLLILLAYHKWGEECPKYLIGDFAFMIWDEKRQKIFGARDFSGSRTLYYSLKNQRFAFSTTIEPILTFPNFQKQLNEIWLAEYLAIEGMIDAVDSSITPYLNINQVPPSHSITVVGNEVYIKRYCTLTSIEQLKLKSSEEYVEAFQEIFQKAVTSRLRTHLNVGTQLSGGLDSGAVASFAAKAVRKENKKLHTFSYIPSKDFKDFTPKQLLADERPYIYSTVKHLGDVKDHYFDFKGKSSFSEIDEFLEIMEMPYKFFENSFWLKGMFEKGQREGLGILLSGDRGNFTISWGPALEYYAVLLKRLKWVRLFRELDQYSKNVGGPRLGRMKTIAKVGFPTIDNILSKRNKSVRPKLINPNFAEDTGVYKRFKEYGIDRTGWYCSPTIYKERKKHFEDVFHWNAGNTHIAKLSLRHSLWKRDPTNDLRVVRFCISLPEDQYVQNGLDRSLIRRATKGYLPDKVRLNQRIRGVQGADWVHRMIPQWDSFLSEVKELSLNKQVQQYLNGQVLNDAILKLSNEVRPEYATDRHYKVLMRSVIVYRFIRKFT
ncbi:MAG TPA: lasso peptide isopeptide bond-forming cyclase [Niallia sp.]|nr:lasso peptide isopeptide bond-forming cyclase [Niallia sp.]